MPGSTVEILPCPPPERKAALGVLYRRVPEPLRPKLVAEALEEARQGALDLSGLWIVRRRGHIAGVLLTQHLAGRAAAVWAPEVEAVWGRSKLAVDLIHSALNDLRRRGVRIAQALVDATSPRQGAADLTRAGMPKVTELTYLARDVEPPLDLDPTVPRLDWRSFAPDTEDEFRQVLQGTYTGSLDMPELEGVRSLDDVLASHRAGGRFEPQRWQVGRVPSEPGAAAILLLTALPDRDAWEIAYLGLTPPARGRGLGRAALAQALAMARPHVASLELAVDVRNLPAERLYRGAGFRPFDRRSVHIKVMDADS